MNQALHICGRKLRKEFLLTLIMWHRPPEKNRHLALVRLVNHLEMRLLLETLFLELVSLSRWRWSFL